MDDIKYIQSIMGHTDASTTLNIYSELRKNNAKSKHEALKKEGNENVRTRGFYSIFTPVKIKQDKQ